MARLGMTPGAGLAASIAPLDAAKATGISHMTMRYGAGAAVEVPVQSATTPRSAAPARLPAKDVKPMTADWTANARGAESPARLIAYGTLFTLASVAPTHVSAHQISSQATHADRGSASTHSSKANARPSNIKPAMRAPRTPTRRPNSPEGSAVTAKTTCPEPMSNPMNCGSNPSRSRYRLNRTAWTPKYVKPTTAKTDSQRWTLRLNRRNTCVVRVGPVVVLMRPVWAAPVVVHH